MRQAASWLAAQLGRYINLGVETSSRVQTQGLNVSRVVAAPVVATIALLCVVGVMDATRRALDAVDTFAAATPPRGLSALDARYLAEVVRALDVAPGTKDYARLDTMYVATSRKYSAQPILTFVHVVSGILILLLAPLQLWERFRIRHLRVHRFCGKVVLGAALGLAVSGAYFGWVQPTGGNLEATAVAVFGGFFVVAGSRAYVLIRRGDVVRHREWMTRMFAVALGSSTIRLVALGSLAALNGGPDMINRRSVGFVFWLGWLLTLACTELWIRGHRAKGQQSVD